MKSIHVPITLLRPGEGKNRPGGGAVEIRRGRVRAKRPTGSHRALTASQFDKTTAVGDVDIANIAADKALVASRQLDLSYTKVIAPVSGRVNRYIVTEGNLIQSGDQFGGTLLTTLESIDPMYAYFDVDEYTICAIRQLTRAGKSDSPREDGFADLVGVGQRGRVSSPRNDQLRRQSGSIRKRAPCGCVAYSPIKTRFSCRDCSCRVRIPIGRPHNAVARC